MEDHEIFQSNPSTSNLVENEDEGDNKNSHVPKFCSWCSRITVEPPMCAVFFALNICGVVMTNLIMKRTCEIDLGFNETECNLLGSNTEEAHRIESLVQPHASVFITTMTLILSILPAIFSLFLGPWSDYNGRKFILLSSMLGLAASFSIHAILSYFPNIRPIFFLLAALPCSVSGGIINLISSGYSYISDITTEENRALRLGLFEATIYIGMLLGMVIVNPILSISGSYGYVVVLSTAALITLSAFLYTLCLVPETITPREEPSSTKALFQLRFLREMLSITFKRRENYDRALICLALVVMTITLVAGEGEANLLYLFTRLRFGWDIRQYTMWFCILIATHFVGLIIGCFVLTKVLKLPDIVLVFMSFFMKLIQCFVYPFIPSTASYLMYWMQLIGFLGAVGGPAMRSVLSKIVPKEDTGKVFFLATSCESLFPLIFTPIYTILYNSTINTLPGTFFLLSASFYALNLVICCFIYFIRKKFGGVISEIDS